MCFILGISTTMIGQIKLQTILSQLKIKKVNITENLESKTTKSLQKNARILKRKENEKKKKNIYIYISFFIVRFVYLNGLPIVALTLKVSNKNN